MSRSYRNIQQYEEDILRMREAGIVLRKKSDFQKIAQLEKKIRLLKLTWKSF